MGSREISEALKRRGEDFLRSARYNLSVGAYDLSVFDAHQAAELYLKGVLLTLVGTYPRTHDLTELVEDWMAEACGGPLKSSCRPGETGLTTSPTPTSAPGTR